MRLTRPKEYELVIDPVTDYVTALTALAFAALRSAPTKLANIERTELLAAFEPFLAAGGAEILWSDGSATVTPGERRPFVFMERLPDYESFRYALALAATRAGSKLAIIDDFDETLQNVVLACRRMGAEIEFVSDKSPHLLVNRPVDKEIKYYLKRESAKIVPQLVLLMAAQGGHSELNDLFESSRFDYLFGALLAGFQREDLTKIDAADELERRLQKRAPRVLEYKSRVTISGGLQNGAVTVNLRPDAEFAAFLAAAVVNHPRGRLVLRRVHQDDITATPLSQLRRMGADVAGERRSDGHCLVVTRSEVKSRSVNYDQMHDYPDAIGAIALANARADGTAVIRSSPFNTEREEVRRRNVSGLIRSFGVKVAEISDGIVLEGRSELTADTITAAGDPICSLMAAAAVLGTIDEANIDDLQAARARWGANFARVLDLVTESGA